MYTLEIRSEISPSFPRRLCDEIGAVLCWHVLWWHRQIWFIHPFSTYIFSGPSEYFQRHICSVRGAIQALPPWLTICPWKILSSGFECKIQCGDIFQRFKYCYLSTSCPPTVELTFPRRDRPQNEAAIKGEIPNWIKMWLVNKLVRENWWGLEQSPF